MPLSPDTPKPRRYQDIRLNGTGPTIAELRMFRAYDLLYQLLATRRRDDRARADDFAREVDLLTDRYEQQRETR